MPARFPPARFGAPGSWIAPGRTALLAWGRRNAPLLGLDASTLEVDGGNASFRVNQDGFPTAVVSARFIQRDPDGTAGLPKQLEGRPPGRGDDVIAEGGGRIRHAVHTPVPGIGAAGEALLGRLVDEAQPLALDALDCLRVDPPASSTTSSPAAGHGSPDRVVCPRRSHPRTSLGVADDSSRRARVGSPSRPLPTSSSGCSRLSSTMPAGDGVRAFNEMYLVTTRQVDAAIGGAQFDDPEFMARLDVVFANLYLHALELTRGRPDSIPAQLGGALRRPVTIPASANCSSRSRA